MEKRPNSKPYPNHWDNKRFGDLLHFRDVFGKLFAAALKYEGLVQKSNSLNDECIDYSLDNDFWRTAVKDLTDLNRFYSSCDSYLSHQPQSLSYVVFQK